MIRILEKNVADKIAAGEVVDRPVSIVKELLENALDADATAITVEIKNGGKSYIRLTDNGCGIPAEEAELAFKRHATSKITSAKDLDAIGTLGFRGEALASICAVSRVELVTKTADSKMGRRIIVEGSEVLENTAVGCPEGTTVTVRDLFYNVPARQKFLATDNSEARRIIDMVSRISLAYGDVKISLINGAKKVFTTHGRGNILTNIVNVYGSDTGKDLLPVERQDDRFIVKGFVSAPSASLASRSRQIFCVNGRVVSSKVLEKAVDEAYKEKLFQGRFPLAFLFLAVPPETLDVNIHPTKKEVRFDDNFEVEDFVKKAIITALSRKEAMPQVRSEDVGNLLSGDEKVSDTSDSVRIEETPGAYAPEGILTSGQQETNEEFHQNSEQVDVRSLLSTMRQEKQAQEEISKNQQEPEKIYQELLVPQEPETRPFDFESLEYLGSIFDTYIMATDQDCFYLIDQHAVHERVFYEKLLEQYNAAEKASQQLLVPLQFHVAAHVEAGEDDWIGELSGMGYGIENFGNKTYIVREIPAFMELREAESFLNDLFQELEDRPDLTDQKVLEKIIMRSCKSAVKGGDHLKEEEIAALIKDLKNCVNPFSCPHGRPTFVRMTKYQLEKMFKRV
ncbi:MAG: DNA mismatch repair endonuclease MutL [Bacillota bacterium]|nr:DNA mismatch repair endonuclease MutL [Bacillota bacterium]